GYLFTGGTATARPGCVEVPGVTLSLRLPTRWRVWLDFGVWSVGHRPAG
ncbi:hypothetical protein CLV92_1351, partial [Kineococcus xinjiangensis]